MVDSQGDAGFEEGRPHPLSRGEQMLFILQRDFGFLYDFKFNVAVGCERGYDELSGRDLGLAWITPDLAHHLAMLAVEIDGVQHRVDGADWDDQVRDGLLDEAGFEVLRIPSYRVYDEMVTVATDIEYAAGIRLATRDFVAGVPREKIRILPRGGHCSACGRWGSGHPVGTDHLCLACCAADSNSPYGPPFYGCSYCERKMAGVSDLETWLRVIGPPDKFECPDGCAEPYEDD